MRAVDRLGRGLAATLLLGCVQNNPAFTGDSTAGTVADDSADETSGTSLGQLDASEDGDGDGGSGGGSGGATGCAPDALCLEEHALLSGYDAFDVAVADFDDDAWPDVLLGFEGGALVAFGGGDGYADEIRLVDQALAARRVLAADVDRDGRLDTAYSRVPANTVVWHPGLGRRAFGPPQPVDAGTDPLGVAVLDLDGDAINDLAAALDSANLLSWRRGDGAGGFAMAETLAIEAPRELLSRDLTDDGRDDLVVVHGAADPAMSGVTIAIADATGLSVSEVAVGSEPVAVATIGYDDDGFADLAVAGAAGPAIVLLQGAAAGSFVEAGTVPLPSAPTDVASGDFDADGVTDLVVTHTDATLTVLRGQGGAAFEATTVTLALRAVAVATGDLDVDGRDDVVLATAQFPEGGVTVLMSR